jgi:hypothetical protein
MAFFCGRVKAAATALTVLLSLTAGTFASAQAAARFDLAGPRIDVRVTRDGKTLPIAAVPNLQSGDKLWLMADLPRTQSVHYLLVVVFLRGTTNPPAGSALPCPRDWRRLLDLALRRAGTPWDLCTRLAGPLRSRLRATAHRKISCLDQTGPPG